MDTTSIRAGQMPYYTNQSTNLSGIPDEDHVHTRDAHYSNTAPVHLLANSPIQAPQSYNDIWTCGGCGAENLDWCDQCPVCGTMRENACSPGPAPYDADLDLAATHSCPGAGSVAEGTWVCSECKCSNSKIHDVCGSCGAAK